MNYSNQAQAKLKILKDRLEGGRYFNVEACLRHIANRTGDPYACKAELQEFALVKAMLAWFLNQDLVAFKQWCFVSAKLLRSLYQERPKNYYMTSAHLVHLMSDDASLIEWFARFEYPFALKDGYSSPERITDLNTHDHHHYNTLLALRGDWELLARRSRSFLEDVPPKFRDYEADHRFTLALAGGDAAGMEQALNDLVQPALMKRRQDEERGDTQGLICTVAVVYAKIAWRHGFPINLDSPWIPRAWLPVSPLATYEDMFDFLSHTDASMPMAQG